MLLAEEKPFVPPYTSLTDFLPTEEIPSILDALPPQISSNLLKGLGTLSQPPPLPQVIETPNALADSDFDTQTGVLPSSLSEFLPEDLPDLSTLDKTVIQDFDASFPLDEELDIPPPVDHTPYIPLPPKLDINWIPESDVPEPIISNPEIFIEDEVMNESEDASAIFSASDSEIVSTEDIEATLEEHIIEEELANTPSTPSQSEPEVSAPTIPSFMTLPQPLPETAQPKAFVVPKTLNFSVTTPAVYPLPGKRIVNLLLPKTEKSAPALPSPPPPADKSNAVKILTPGSVERLLARNITQASQAAPEPAPAPSPTPAPAPTPEAASAPVPTVVPAPEPKEEPKAPTVPELVPEKPVPASVPAPAAPQIIVVEGTTVNITQQVPIVVNNLPVQQLPNIPEAPIVPPASVAKETEVIEAASVLAPTDEVPKPLLTQKKNKKVVLAVIPPPKETEILVAIPPKIKKRRPRVNAGSANYKSNRENTRKWTKARTKRYNFHKDGIH